MEETSRNDKEPVAIGGPDLRGVALACSQINGARQILGDLADDAADDRLWAVIGSLDSALSLIEPLKEWS